MGVMGPNGSYIEQCFEGTPEMCLNPGEIHTAVGLRGGELGSTANVET